MNATAPPPLPGPQTPQADAEIRQLDLLGTLYYVLAALTALFSLIPLLHLAMGVAMLNGRFGMTPTSQNPPDVTFFAWMFIGMSIVFILMGMACAVLFLLTGQRLRQRRSHTFCLVGAGLSCMFMPLGTVLGVFALIALTKPTAREYFGTA